LHCGLDLFNRRSLSTSKFGRVWFGVSWGCRFLAPRWSHS